MINLAKLTRDLCNISVRHLANHYNQGTSIVYMFPFANGGSFTQQPYVGYLNTFTQSYKVIQNIEAASKCYWGSHIV